MLGFILGNIMPPELSPNPQTYRMKPGSAEPFAKLGHYLIGLVWAALAVSFAITCWAERDSGWTRGTFIYLALQLLIVLTIGSALSFFNLRFFNRWAQRMESLEIVISDDRLLRRQQDHPDLIILRSENQPPRRTWAEWAANSGRSPL